MTKPDLAGLGVSLLLLAASASVWAGPFDSAVGQWWGQAEYLASVNAVVDETSQAVVDLSVQVEAGGKVSGSSPDNGCRISGILRPFVSPQVFQSQVTVSGCRAANLNGRYSGPVTAKPKEGTLALSLSMSQPGGLGRASKSGTITVTMVRK